LCFAQTQKRRQMPLVYPRSFAAAPRGGLGEDPQTPFRSLTTNQTVASKSSSAQGGAEECTTLNVLPVFSSKVVPVSTPPLALHLGRPAKVPGCEQKWVRNERSDLFVNDG
jgi:hypothetical protein